MELIIPTVSTSSYTPEIKFDSLCNQFYLTSNTGNGFSTIGTNGTSIASGGGASSSGFYARKGTAGSINKAQSLHGQVFLTTTTAGYVAYVKPALNTMSYFGYGSQSQPAGGLKVSILFSLYNSFTAGNRLFVGLSSVATPTNIDLESASATAGIYAGIYIGGSDLTIKSTFGNDTAVKTTASMGVTASAPSANLPAELFELTIYSPPNENGKVYLTLKNHETGNTYTADSGATVMTNALNVALSSLIQVTNNASTNQAGFICNRIYGRGQLFLDYI